MTSLAFLTLPALRAERSLPSRCAWGTLCRGDPTRCLACGANGFVLLRVLPLPIIAFLPYAGGTPARALRLRTLRWKGFVSSFTQRYLWSLSVQICVYLWINALALGSVLPFTVYPRRDRGTSRSLFTPLILRLTIHKVPQAHSPESILEGQRQGGPLVNTPPRQITPLVKAPRDAVGTTSFSLPGGSVLQLA